jgi:hypothetical protein
MTHEKLSLINLGAIMAGAADIPAFRSMRTLRALRPLRAVSRWEGMRVSRKAKEMEKVPKKSCCVVNEILKLFVEQQSWSFWYIIQGVDVFLFPFLYLSLTLLECISTLFCVQKHLAKKKKQFDVSLLSKKAFDRAAKVY